MAIFLPQHISISDIAHNIYISGTWRNKLERRPTRTSLILLALMVVCIAAAVGEICLGDVTAASYATTWALISFVGSAIVRELEMRAGGL